MLVSTNIIFIVFTSCLQSLTLQYSHLPCNSWVSLFHFILRLFSLVLNFYIFIFLTILLIVLELFFLFSLLFVVLLVLYYDLFSNLALVVLTYRSLGFFFLYFLKVHFYWSIVTFQCRVSFCCAAQWIRYMYTCISSFLGFLPV